MNIIFLRNSVSKLTHTNKEFSFIASGKTTCLSRNAFSHSLSLFILINFIKCEQRVYNQRMAMDRETSEVET